ncbi:hypothetical protein J6590_023133 [Homalodisca vitripennis]|nr:hypothetical protein J6590_092971 [Homalodisca vitripennis]KAG8307364.1 hypothetical protein J6590_023133 [Homalodisca vitripennis]
MPSLPGLHNENITAVVHHLNKGAGTQDTKANCSTLAGKLLRHVRQQPMRRKPVMINGLIMMSAELVVKIL